MRSNPFIDYLGHQSRYSRTVRVLDETGRTGAKGLRGKKTGVAGREEIRIGDNGTSLASRTPRGGKMSIGFREEGAESEEKPPLKGGGVRKERRGAIC